MRGNHHQAEPLWERINWGRGRGEREGQLQAAETAANSETVGTVGFLHYQ